jgi:FlaA1/EpsC-like NDP-sugar epimerase
LYALAAASGSIALVLRHIPYKDSIAMLGLWFFFLLLFGIYLFRTNVASHSKKVFGTLNDLDHVALIVDPLILSLGYYLGFFLVFRNLNSPDYVSLFLLSWPVVVGVEVISLHLWRVYRSSWWRGSMVTAYKLVGGIVTGTFLSLLFLMGLHKTYGNYHVVLMLDAAFSWVLLITMRTSFPFFKGVLQSLESRTAPGRRVFILGTSEHTHAAIQFLKGQGIYCVGLIDTNGGGDLGRLVWGKRVLGRLTDLSKLALEYRTCEIVLPESELIPCSESELMNRCSRENLQLIKLGLYSPSEIYEDNSVSQEKAKSTMVGSF